MSVFDFPKAKETVSTKPEDLARAHRGTVGVVNNILGGKLNAVKEVTLTSSAGSTTVSDPRLTINSFVAFDPLNSDAASELAAGTLYVDSDDRRNGQFTLTHANNGQTRSFKMLIIG